LLDRCTALGLRTVTLPTAFAATADEPAR
jgi:hypothetical protein